MNHFAELLALAALGISVLSAIYAKRAAAEAKRANRLSAHDHKLEIYRAFDSVRFAVLREGLGISHSEVSALYRPSREAEFYFPEPICNKLVAYYDTCFELAELNGKLQFRTHLTEEGKEALRQQQDSASEKEQKLAAALGPLLQSNLEVVV